MRPWHTRGQSATDTYTVCSSAAASFLLSLAYGIAWRSGPEKPLGQPTLRVRPPEADAAQLAAAAVVGSLRGTQVGHTTGLVWALDTASLFSAHAFKDRTFGLHSVSCSAAALCG